MSNSAVLFVPAARCCVRVCPSLRMCLRFRVRRASPQGLWRRRPSRQQQFRPPDEGWMERRQAHSLTSVAPAKRDPLSRGDRDLSRRSTVAVFGCGPTKPAPGSGTGAAATARASRKGLAVGVRTSRVAVRAAVAGRHSLLRLSGSFLENAPLSQDTNPCTTNSIRSQHQSHNVAVIGKWADQSTMPASRRALLVG